MRIATWNVNSLKARQEAVEKWLERAAPDILLIQETKLGDVDAPVMAFAMAGYELVHHGEGRWNGVAIAARQGLARRRRRHQLRRRTGARLSGPGAHGRQRGRLRPVRRGADAGGDRRRDCAFVAVYAPNGRVVGSPFYDGKLKWFERLGRWLDETAAGRGEALVLVGGDFNVAPADIDVWDARAAHGGTHVSEPERAAVRRAPAIAGSADTLPRPARRARALHAGGTTGPACSTRTSGCASTCCLTAAPSPSGSSARRSTARRARARRCRPTTRRSSIDLDEPGKPFDAGWDDALARIRARTRPGGRKSPAQVRYEEERRPG